MISFILGTDNCYSHEYPAHKGISYGISLLWAATYSFGTVVYTPGISFNTCTPWPRIGVPRGVSPDATGAYAHPPVCPIPSLGTAVYTLGYYPLFVYTPGSTIVAPCLRPNPIMTAYTCHGKA